MLPTVQAVLGQSESRETRANARGSQGPFRRVLVGAGQQCGALAHQDGGHVRGTGVAKPTG